MKDIIENLIKWLESILKDLEDALSPEEPDPEPEPSPPDPEPEPEPEPIPPEPEPEPEPVPPEPEPTPKLDEIFYDSVRFEPFFDEIKYEDIFALKAEIEHMVVEKNSTKAEIEAAFAYMGKRARDHLFEAVEGVYGVEL